MTRAAIALLIALAGCDRVFGLIGDDSDPTRDGGTTDAPDSSTIDTRPDEPFCMTNAVNALFCADFDTQIGNALTDFSILEADGTVSENQQRAVSTPQSARIELVEDGDAKTPPRAILAHRVDFSTTPPSTYDFDVFIDSGSAGNDVTLFAVDSGPARLALRASGLRHVSGGSAMEVSSPIPHGAWAHVEIGWNQAQGQLSIAINHSAPVIATASQTLLSTSETVSLGLEESSPAAGWVVFYDNLLVR